MDFKTLNDLLSINDLKRLGLPDIEGIPFSDQPLMYIFAKGYEQKRILDDVSEEFSRRLLELTPLFEPLAKISCAFSPNLYLHQGKDGAFEFTFDFKNGLSFILGYYYKKYGFNPSKIIPGYGEELNKAKDEEVFTIFEEVFLKIFRLVNVAFHDNINSSRKEEVSCDRKLAKYLSKNVREVVQALKQPLNLSILEGINKDRFSLLIAIRALVTLGDMEKGVIEKQEDLKRAAINYLERYMAITDYISKKSNQEYSFSFYADGETFDYKELKYVYGVYCEEHPEITSEIRSMVDCADLFRRYLIDARTKIKKDEFVKAVKLRFQLFPKGEAKVKGVGDFSRKSVVSEDVKRLLEEKHEALLEEKINFFTSTNYLWTLEESQTFDGYRGHIYPNGKVIFEKFYRTTRDGLSADYDKSFISMNLLDFIELAPKTKTELMELIRECKDRDIRRHYHVPGWQQKAEAIINEETPEYDFDLIETLLSEISNTKPQDFGKPYRK